MNWLRQWRKNMKFRTVSIRMLHIGLNNHFWYPQDIWFVITGRA